MNAFDPQSFGPVFAPLVARAEPNELGPGAPNEALGPQLRALSLQAAFAPTKIADHEMAQACLAGLWLLHDFFSESHEISQSLDTPSGAYWHGILHRREPDYGNAKYWFRQVGRHPVFEPLVADARQLAANHDDRAAAFLQTQTSWDPFRFVDLCEAAAGNSTNELLCRQIQQREWQWLFEFCFRAATASA